MSLSIAVLGASGVYGRHLVPRLISRGHRVRALVRRPDRSRALAQAGADVRAADIFDVETLRSGFAGCDAVVNLATAVPRTGHPPDFALNDRIRREGTRAVVEACADASVERLIQQSIVMVHGNGQGWVDEESPLHRTGATDSAIDMEAWLTATDRQWIILRGGLFYGPGTGREEDWFARARAGTLKIPGDGSDFVSLVHIADMAEATAIAVERAPPRTTLIVCDDDPSPWQAVLTWVAALVNAPEPPLGAARALPSFRASNRRAREVLDWRPHYPNFRTGLV